jgi:predicted nucleic acid-binding Zn finger protein
VLILQEFPACPQFLETTVGKKHRASLCGHVISLPVALLDTEHTHLCEKIMEGRRGIQHLQEASVGPCTECKPV